MPSVLQILHFIFYNVDMVFTENACYCLWMVFSILSIALTTISLKLDTDDFLLVFYNTDLISLKMTCKAYQSSLLPILSIALTFFSLKMDSNAFFKLCFASILHDSEPISTMEQ